MSDEMPKEIWVDCKINNAGYFQVDGFSSKKLTSLPVSSFQRVKYTRADQVKPRGNKAALEALASIKKELFEIANERDASPLYYTSMGNKLKTIREYLEGK